MLRRKKEVKHKINHSTNGLSSQNKKVRRFCSLLFKLTSLVDFFLIITAEESLVCRSLTINIQPSSVLL